MKSTMQWFRGALCVLAAMVWAGSAQAATFSGTFNGTFDLDGSFGTVDGISPASLVGTTVSGMFSFDAVNLTSGPCFTYCNYHGPINMTATFDTHTYTKSNSTSTILLAVSPGLFDPNQYVEMDVGTNDPSFLDLNALAPLLYTDAAQLSSLLSFTITEQSGFFVQSDNGRLAFDVTWSMAATPLPATLPLFASGLGALGLLGGWRRKKKAATFGA